MNYRNLAIKTKDIKKSTKITISALILYPTVRSAMDNKVLHSRCRKKHLMIILYLIVCSNVKNIVLLVRGKKTISLTTTISKMEELQIFQTTLLKPLPMTMTFTLWNRCRNIVIETENWSF